MRRGYIVGDSKGALSNDTNTWVSFLYQALDVSTGAHYNDIVPRGAYGGYDAERSMNYLLDNLAATPGVAEFCTVNLGANDVQLEPPHDYTEAEWKGRMISIIDQLRAKWPDVQVYVAKAWRRGYAARCDQLAGWIDDIIASYTSGVHAGPDERVWLENGDDGTTYTDDGTHYNAAGNIECAAQWLAVMLTD